jgi:hypothetical protein
VRARVGVKNRITVKIRVGKKTWATIRVMNRVRIAVQIRIPILHAWELMGLAPEPT